MTHLFRGRKVKFPFPRQNQEIVRHIAELIEAGGFRPVIDRRCPLERIADAYRYVETGQKTGSVVITVVPPT
ncbi:MULTISPECIES: zinc-binding dehydrogenase [unclassified Streptomyces]|uniref:zinc-binding dehydrogenase n=1 Tax=Streptomyces TaxID=1883 RepID=UPI001C408D1C|nr:MULTISPECIES: zinc-binding dehydrogenase [unclassified Streptomyces]